MLFVRVFFIAAKTIPNTAILTEGTRRLDTNCHTINSIHHTTTCFLHRRKQKRDNRISDRCLCLRYIEQSLYSLNPKFQACSHLLWSYSPACFGPCRKLEPKNRVSHEAVHIVTLRAAWLIGLSRGPL